MIEYSAIKVRCSFLLEERADLPAGASLACFLGRSGNKGIMLCSAPSTADTPRAHINNMAAMDTMRDIGLWDECKKLGHGGDFIKHFRWCESMGGEEYARNYCWGMNGDRKGDYELASPCTHLDLPQSVLEPILVRYAGHHGFKVRFDTKFLSFSEDAASGKISCLVEDRVRKQQYRIVTKYLFGADGGRSRVADQLGLPFTVMPGGGLSYNIRVKADLKHIMASRPGNLHWVCRLRRDYPFMCVGRMVKPWDDWMFVLFPKGPDVVTEDKSYDEWRQIIVDMIDDSRVRNVEVEHVSKWNINETWANVISKGNM